ncbi:helix-turn-helix domain-containing protein [cf. Phormidesmis sp. LEGE 11477]|uniref:helix-turn-helix domain-containing protein n=1 Tax=cf. Phormidesmis sp. LEGE 11477 TaxID=1828680 RepID=UPI001880C2E9|nr:helix-turn-helix domain-containing protein [cf. Phormidesmis sp. LEGE 11477]MBE9063919.1 helix-turn-helix domain-containing protein [cf. Phormidesmis sp. LEGE 11477]
MARSVCLHPDYRDAIPSVLERNGFLTQGDLAAHLLIALSTVNNFCRGIRVSVAKFEQICEALGLDPHEIMLPKGNIPLSNKADSSTSPKPAFFAYDAFWVGRESLVTTLTEKLSSNCRLLLLTGLSGIGKTALAERLTANLQDQKQPHQHSHYRLLRENFDQKEQSTDFISFATRLLEGCGQLVALEERTQSSVLIRRLVTHLQTTPTLILIDSLEQILHGNNEQNQSQFQDDGFVTFFQALLASSTCQSRLIITSQELPSQIVETGSRYQTLWHRQAIKGLSESEQQALFQQTGFIAGDPNLVRIGKAYEGHPLALRTILGEISDTPFFGNVSAYWKRYRSEIEAVEKALAAAALGHTTGADDKWQLDRFTRALRRNVQTRLENTLARLRQDARGAYILLCESSVYRCAVPEDWWLSHLEDWEFAAADQTAALDVLRDRYLVEEVVEAVTDEPTLLLKQHNLIRSLSLSHLKMLSI